jgi:hypothetical protein
VLAVSVLEDEIRIGERFSVCFQRTLRIPEDDREYPLPPGLGRFPISRAADFADAVPADWLERDDAFVPLYQREALWLAFEGAPWKPNAVRVAAGEVDAVSGGEWDAPLSADPQNYVVAPHQPWLDGFNAGEGFVRQFVAVPLGRGLTVEAQVSGREEVGGLQLRVFEPRPGRFPDEPPPDEGMTIDASEVASPQAAEMGLGAGGRIRQQVFPDPHGLDAWDPDNSVAVHVHIVNSAQFQELTGKEPPVSPVTAATYTELGLPWFDLYDEELGDVEVPDVLTSLRGTGEGGEESVDVEPGQVRKIERRDDGAPDGGR